MTDQTQGSHMIVDVEWVLLRINWQSGKSLGEVKIWK